MCLHHNHDARAVQWAPGWPTSLTCYIMTLWAPGFLASLTCCAVMLQRAPHGFLPDMKLEAVDKRNPRLVRVATITDIDDYRVKVHLYLLYQLPNISCASPTLSSPLSSLDFNSNGE